MAMMSPTEIRLKLRALGYAPIPVSGKKPSMEGWQTKLGVNTDEIKLWEHLYPYDNNTGVITRTTPLFDVDVLLKECGDAIEAMVREFFEERGELLTRVGLAPKRGLAFRTDEPFKKILTDFQVPEGVPSQRLEFLCDGQQFVAYGVHPDTGLPYRWHARELAAVAREDLPYIREADARDLIERATAIALDFGYRLKSDGEAKGGNGSTRPKREPGEPQNFFQRTNAHALDHIEPWAKTLFPTARYQKATGAWRVTSKDLGRSLEEDLSLHPDGIWDFGTERPYTAIDLVREYQNLEVLPSALWLCEQMKVEPTELGYVEPKPKPKANDEQVLAELNRDNAVVLDGARTLILRFERDERDMGGERYTYFVPTFLRPADFRLLYLNRRIEVGRTKDDQPITIDLGRWWLNHRKRRQYRGVVFVPAGPAVIDGRLNLWRGWGVEPAPGEWGLLRKHISEVLAAGDAAVDSYIIKWLAWAVQRPAEQAEVALVFIGDRGTGKGTLGKALCRIFGQHAVHLSSPEQLTGRFNAHLRQCSFLFADEAYGPKDKSAEGALQRLVTEDTLRIEPKGRDSAEEPNRLHVMFASNNDWVIPAGAHERRWVVQRVAETYRQDSTWFKPIYQEMKSGGVAAMLYDLLRFNLGDWHPREIVRTAALAEQQLQSLSALDEWWVEVLHTGVLVGSIPYEPHRAVSNHYEEGISESDGYGVKRTRIRRREGLYNAARASSPRLRSISDNAIGHYLTNKVGAERDRPRQRRGWEFPPLATCRDRWAENFPDTEWRDQGITGWRAEPED
jgi:8-oxo-dGTP pyrophosphatase MutT (NUDIX family)